MATVSTLFIITHPALALAWTPTQPILIQPLLSSRARPRPPTAFRPCKTATSHLLAASQQKQADENDDGMDEDNNGDDDLLSDLDARVLQSMLQEADKLDLQQETNMKKLLERGIVSKEKVTPPGYDAASSRNNNKNNAKDKDEAETPYSSQVLQTLADTKLWRALKRNAADWAESAKIALSNRIERDAKVVLSLGLFAWERAVQDVGRALPAASSAVKNTPVKKMFQLSDTSSFQEPPSTKPEKDLSSADLRRELSTPQDEIRAVSKEIQQIFQQADQQMAAKKVSPFFATRVERPPAGASSLSSSSSANTLQSTARRGTARLDQAFKRQQQTKLAREKENIAQSGSRLASNLIDSAYQVQRELQVEPNQPGYKTKRLRQATASTARQIAAAARQTSAKLLSGKKPPTSQNPTGTALPASGSASANTPAGFSDNAAATTVKADPVDFIDQEAYFAFKRGHLPDENDDALDMLGENISSKFMDVLDAEVSTTSNERRQQQQQQRTTEMNYASIYADMVSTGALTGGNTDAIESPIASIDTTRSYDSGPELFYDNNDNTVRQVMAEVISDDDFEGAVGTAKQVNNLSAEELLQALEEEEGTNSIRDPPNIFVQLSLRSLDVVFLVVEKVIVLLPRVVAVSSRVTSRFVDVSRDGLGQQGWQPLNTKVRGDRRY